MIGIYSVIYFGLTLTKIIFETIFTIAPPPKKNYYFAGSLLATLQIISWVILFYLS